MQDNCASSLSSKNHGFAATFSTSDYSTYTESCTIARIKTK